jgi:hypothetical protein
MPSRGSVAGDDTYFRAYPLSLSEQSQRNLLRMRHCATMLHLCPACCETLKQAGRGGDTDDAKRAVALLAEK